MQAQIQRLQSNTLPKPFVINLIEQLENQSQQFLKEESQKEKLMNITATIKDVIGAF